VFDLKKIIFQLCLLTLNIPFFLAISALWLEPEVSFTEKLALTGALVAVYLTILAILVSKTIEG